MTVTVHRRAEIALGTLDLRERQTFLHGLQRLQTDDRESLVSSGRLRPLTGPAEGLFAFRASQRLRAVLSLGKSGWVVEDVVSPARLTHLLARDRNQ
ncbi:MAG: hypothetical protein FJX75_11245 [Armatimonadetes bacterium]|nr:hypothetical protein [Armatimonadota bacterium]